MKLLKLLTITSLIKNIRPSLINNKKLCRDCKYYISTTDRECRKFGDVNLVTGKEYYDSARSVRDDENKCGENAILFEKNHFKLITIPYYFLLEYWIFTPIVGFFAYYSYLFYGFINK
jgi:hypothetical protein